MLTVYIVLVVSLAVMAARRPAYAIVAIVLTFGLEQWSMTIHPIFVQRTYLGNVIIGLIVLVALISRFGDRRSSPPPQSRCWWLVLLLYAWSALTVLWSLNESAALDVWSKHLPYIVVFVLAAPLVMMSKQDYEDALKGFLIYGGAVISLLAFTTTVFGRFIQSGSGLERISGNPLAIAQFASVVAIAAIFVPFRTHLWGGFRVCIIALAVYLVIRSGSRGEFIGLIAVAYVGTLLRHAALSPKVAILTTIGALFLTAVSYVAFGVTEGQGSPRSRWDAAVMIENYQGGRLNTASRLLELWESSSPFNWIVGLGNSASFHDDAGGFYPHVVPLEVLAEEGLVGFALFLMICGLCISSCRRGFGAIGARGYARSQFTAFVSIWFFFLIISLKAGNLLGSQLLFLFTIVTAKFGTMFQERADRSHEWNDHETADSSPLVSRDIGAYPQRLPDTLSG